jgi:hypothetical protein
VFVSPPSGDDDYEDVTVGGGAEPHSPGVLGAQV